LQAGGSGFPARRLRRASAAASDEFAVQALVRRATNCASNAIVVLTDENPDRYPAE
jgi:hypothetical protein